MEQPSGPVYKGQQTAMVAVGCIFTVFGFIAVVLRVIARYMIVRSLGADDWFMIIGLLCTCGYLFVILFGIHVGIALHAIDNTVPDLVEQLKLVYAIQLLYNTIVATVKISIVCFYLRLAPADGSLRLRSWGTITFLTLFYIAMQTTSALQCMPIRANWDMTGKIKKKCIDTLVYFYVLASINIIVDIWILVMPISTLKNINRPRRDKIVLFIVFGVGGFSCISSIVRLYTIKVFATSKDPFYDGAPINIWSFIEVNVAIVCASVPAMKPLFTKTIRDRITNASKNSRSGFGTHNHQMIPLSGSDGNQTPSFQNKMHKNTYSVNAISKYGMGDSDEHIVSKHGGIEYEREFSVVEQYIGESDVLPKLPGKVHQ